MAGLSLCLLVAVGLGAWAVLAQHPYVAEPPTGTAHQPQPAQAAAVLHDLEDAVAGDDVAAARRLAPAGDPAARALLAAVVENAHELRVREFTVRYVDEAGAVSRAGSWEAAVETTWQFAGFDRAPAHAEVLFRFVAGPGGVGLASVGGGDRRTPLWMTGRMQVLRTPQTLVMVMGDRAEAERYAVRARAAVPVVRRVLSRWRPRLVVEVPRTASGLDSALDATPGEYANIAAVTTTADGSLAPDAPVHVFVNPEVFAQLKPRGAQVVMSHEAVHVATGAATSVMPLWLLEGFADYVALRDVHLPLSTTAGQIIKRVRAHGPPRSLPGADDFDTTTTHLGATYEAAWLACRLLAQRGGEQALVRFYETVDSGTGVGAALRHSFGLSRADLTRQWRRLLSDLAA